MSKLLHATVLAVMSCLAWANCANAQIDDQKFKDSICVQGFQTPKKSGQLPDGKCDASGSVITSSDLDQFKAALLDIVKLSSPSEAYNLFADSSMTTKIFIIKPPPVPSVSSFNGLEVDLDRSMGWVAWDSGNYKTLYIGISQLALAGLYSMEVHSTAALLQFFWSPAGHLQYNSASQPTMPAFKGITANGKLDTKQLAIYAILSHELAHFWQDKDHIYTSANTGSDPKPPCGNKVPLSTNSFAAISWAYYTDDNSAEYWPPYTKAGIWGCPTKTTSTLQIAISTAVTHLPVGGIQSWPSDSVANFIRTLYNSNLPSALAATSPEEDFADSYTMLALYRAGLVSLCLNAPRKTGTQDPPYDVIYQLFGAKAPFFLKKVSWMQDKKHFPESLGDTLKPTAASSCS
jgi:hypothetical protein